MDLSDLIRFSRKTMIFGAAIALVMVLYGCSKPPVDPSKSDKVEREFTAFLTGYSFWDNTPPGSAAIARPVIHKLAGGIGTYDDPITLAVGHRIDRGRQTLDYPAGTRFYFPRLKKYAIVEDVCGDGPTPQNGPCHAGHKGYPWLDIYVGGQGFAEAFVDLCMRQITGLQQVIIHPKPGLPTRPGVIVQSTCAAGSWTPAKTYPD